jgi:purine-binding chemotaxis protein CheW
MSQRKACPTGSKGEQTDLSAKYLTFVLDGESFGVDILEVREILGPIPIRPIPCTPAFLKGVVNLRGGIIPIVDLQARLCIGNAAESSQNCIIVIDVIQDSGAVPTGILVDSVSEVLDIRADSIENAPAFENSICLDYILGIAKTGRGLIILLDIQKVLGTSEFQELSQVLGDRETRGAES